MIYPYLSLDTINRFSLDTHHQQPLVHCMTNEVVQSITANILLAANIAPAMIVSKQEVEQFVSIADALLINIGTLYSSRADAMLLAVKAAQRYKKPWVLDPVAIGSLTYRTSFTAKLLAHQPTVIRGNASEIMALAGLTEGGRGTDSTDSTESALPAAKKLALTYQTIVIVTGETDFIIDGKQGYSIPWGSPLMTKVTGCGCALSAFIAGYIAKTADHLTASACACAAYALAGQYAALHCKGPGSFLPEFIDAIYNRSYLHMELEL